ncbi:hypothetical protein FS837_002765 [Tulasnella sp. UAMH 9824]|nr:hypothetical protein FS837_002765 [Tulasnella sp. UAMH 9824]
MHRPSTLSSRPSALPPGRAGSSAQSAALRLLEKRQEWEAIAALDEATEEIVKSLEQLAAQGNVMADGGRAVASVMNNWPNVLRVISLFAKDSSGSAAVETKEETAGDGELPRLVRIDANSLAQGN